MSVTVTPERSYEQRIRALELANRIRSTRKVLKRDLKARTRSVDWLLLEPPAEILSMKVLDLLLAAPKVGRVKADKMLRLANVSPSKTVGGLTGRQRRQLLAVLGGYRR